MRIVKHILIIIATSLLYSCSHPSNSINQPRKFTLIVRGDDVITSSFAKELRKGNVQLRHIGIDAIEPNDTVIFVDGHLRQLPDNTSYVSYNVLIQSHDRKFVKGKLVGTCEIARIAKCAKSVLAKAATELGVR